MFPWKETEHDQYRNENTIILYKDWLKSSLADIITAVDFFFDQWNPSTAAPMEKECESWGGGTMLKK